MFEIRLHGRGGQGVVTMAELLAAAAFDAGHEVQAFPSFGSERMGAPVTSFCRVATHPIEIREPIIEPDLVVICDATLLHHVDVFAGLPDTATVLLNTSRSVDQLGLSELADRLADGRIVSVPATELARTHTGRALPTGALLGACSTLVDFLPMNSIEWALRARFKAKVADGNIAAAQVAHALLAGDGALRYA